MINLSYILWIRTVIMTESIFLESCSVDEWSAMKCDEKSRIRKFTRVVNATGATNICNYRAIKGERCEPFHKETRYFGMFCAQRHHFFDNFINSIYHYYLWSGDIKSIRLYFVPLWIWQIEHTFLWIRISYSGDSSVCEFDLPRMILP